MAAKRLLEVQYKPGEELTFRFNTHRLSVLPEATPGAPAQRQPGVPPGAPQRH